MGGGRARAGRAAWSGASEPRPPLRERAAATGAGREGLPSVRLQRAVPIIRSRVAWRRVAACQRQRHPRSPDDGLDSFMPRILATRALSNRSTARPPDGSPSPRTLLLAGLALLLLLPNAATAQAESPAAAASSPQADDAASQAAPAETPRAEWSGALGVNLSYRPEYDGGSRHAVVARPAIYLRYGRFSLSSGASFAARRTDDVVRGLGVDLVRGTRTRISLALRHDSGRQEDESGALRGLGDVKATVRARVSARRQLDERWRVAASWTVDAFGRGGGSFADLQLIRDWALTPQTVASAAAAVTVGGRRYMRSYYGVNEAQAAASGYPVYEPGLGLRDVSLSGSVRTDLGEDWTLLVGGGLSRLLGPARASPLTTRVESWGLNAGLARRF